MDRFVVKSGGVSKTPRAVPYAAPTGSRFAPCPQCERSVPLKLMSFHLDTECGAAPRHVPVVGAAGTERIAAIAHDSLLGQFIVPDFVTEEEEALLLAVLDSDEGAGHSLKSNEFNGCGALPLRAMPARSYVPRKLLASQLTRNRGVLSQTYKSGCSYRPFTPCRASSRCAMRHSAR